MYTDITTWLDPLTVVKIAVLAAQFLLFVLSIVYVIVKITLTIKGWNNRETDPH